MADLHILDMMAFVHAGHVNKKSYLARTVRIGAGWETQVIPTGGASLIFNTLYSILGKGDIVVVSDRNPTIKKEMIAGYKDNRTRKESIRVDKTATEYILQQCGIHVLAREGYEADDLAYSLVKDLRDAYDNIYLYTGDSDWYFMVDNKVSIRKSSSRAKEVTRENFENITGYYYNTITLSKICDGDASDRIPGLSNDASYAIKSKLVNDKLRGMLGSKEVVTNLFKAFFPEYLFQVDNVFPLYVKDLPQSFNKPDRASVCNFGAAIKNKNFQGRSYAGFDAESHINTLCDQGVYLDEDGDDYYG